MHACVCVCVYMYMHVCVCVCMYVYRHVCVCVCSVVGEGLRGLKTEDHKIIFEKKDLSCHHHHHHIALVARISLTLSRHSSLSFIPLGRSSGQHPVSSHSCWMYVRAGRPAFAWPCVGIHKSTSLMSSSLLLQQCPAVSKTHFEQTIFFLKSS